MHSKILFVIIFLMGAQHLMFGQTERSKKDQEKLEEAVRNIKLGKFDSAYKILDQLDKKYPKDPEYKLRKAAGLYSQNDKIASYELHKSIRSSYPAVPNRIFYAMTIQAFELEKYDDVLKWLPEARSAEPDAEEKFKEIEEKSRFRAHAMQNPVPFRIQALPPTVNSPMHSEYLATVSLDRSRLIFTRRVANDEDLYESIWDQDLQTWKEASPIMSLNTPKNEGVHSYSADGRTIIFTACDRTDSYGGCDLYIAKSDLEGFSESKNLGKRINTPAKETQPSLSSDGRILMFSTNRLGTKGGMDLFYTTKNEEGQWSIPINVGDSINTTGNEESPFLHPDGQTLYFRSDGHLGMGSFDLFVSKWCSKTKKWRKPTNLGYPINTAANDGAISVSPDGKTAIYASDVNSFKSQRQNLDLFQFELPESAQATPTAHLRVVVYDEATLERLPAEILFESLGDQNFKLRTLAHKKLHELIPLPMNSQYKLTIDQPGYYFLQEVIDPAHYPLKSDLIQIGLRKIQKLKPDTLVLQSILYEYGTDQIVESAQQELQKIYKILSENPNLKLHIIGHTDDVGSSDANLELSKKRALALQKRLIEKGIEYSRISTEGKGETTPRFPNDTEQNRQKNRRTELIFSD